jgi:subtilisin family serine protease
MSLHVFLSILIISPHAGAAPKPNPAATFDKLSAPLQELASHVSSGRMDAARTEAMTRGLRVSADDRVTLLLEPVRGKSASEISRRPLETLGARVESTSRSWVRVSVPISRLPSLVNHPDVAAVVEPAIPHIDVADGLGLRVSEAVAITGADEWQQSGWRGAGVRVAIIDLGFAGFTAARTAGELPSNTIGVDFTNTGLQTGTSHGTGVAEHVADMAPAAQLYLLKVGDQLDLQNAVDYLRANSIRIANHSVGWVNASYYDGTGFFSNLIDHSRNVDGVFWVISAGNSAKRHWRGTWTDNDGDGWLEFVNGDEGLGITSASARPCIYLNWNQYGNSVTNLDLVVRRSNGTQVAASTAAQGGTRRPAESLCFNYVSADAPYTIAVKRVSGTTTGLDMTIHSFHNDLEHKVAASAFMDPAAAHGAFTVGAVNQSAWNQSNPATEPFSSRGPTNDGRIKPDLTGPDGTTSLTYGTRGAYGTSFSSPTVAGAAALILSRDVTLTADELEDALRFSARDVGTQGNDSTYGSGLLELALPSSGEQPSVNTAPTAVPDAAQGITGQPIVINVLANDFDADGDPLSVRIVTASTKGSAIVKSDRTITFTSTASFIGTTTFTYEVSDPDGATSRAVVTVAVTAAVVVTPPTSPPPSGGTTLASDTFVSTAATGGTGWSGPWAFTGYALPTSLDAPSSAPIHLRLRSGNGLAQRSITPGAASSLRLAFRAKISDFEAGDTAVVKVSKDDGATWITIHTFTSAHSDNVYRSFDLDLAPFGVGSATTLRIAFDADMNAATDYFYIDDVAVHGTR